MEDDLIFISMEDDLQKSSILTNSIEQYSTGNLTNTKTKKKLAKLEKSTLIGCDILVNYPSYFFTWGNCNEKAQ
jgi:hypothetical protein